MMNVRKPQVAGMFYPSDPESLKEQLDNFLSDIGTDESINRVAGLVVPHAGYVYSGKTAAFGYKTIENKDFENVIVISPSHREYFRGISVYSGDAYETPLGKIPINIDLREKMISESQIIYAGTEGHKYEHALEVQLPFLQTVLNEFHLIPLVIGDQRREFIFELANVLANTIDNKTLLIASSDLSHFYTRDQALILDNRVAESINGYKYEQLQSDLENKRCEACGGGGIVAIMKALNLRNYSRAKVIAHTDSGEVTGDNSEVVGYLSAVIYN